jgi:hypothetical protein
MNPISQFLEKFKKILQTGTQVKEFFVRVLKGELNYDADTKNITIKDGVLYFNDKPIVKNEVFMKKEKILTELNQLLPKGKKIIDIR